MNSSCAALDRRTLNPLRANQTRAVPHFDIGFLGQVGREAHGGFIVAEIGYVGRPTHVPGFVNRVEPVRWHGAAPRSKDQFGRPPRGEGATGAAQPTTHDEKWLGMPPERLNIRDRGFINMGYDLCDYRSL
jgi:hypothetical protein